MYQDAAGPGDAQLCNSLGQKTGVQVACSLGSRCQHQECRCAGLTVNHAASILLLKHLLCGQMPPARCPPGDQGGVQGPLHGPGSGVAAWALCGQPSCSAVWSAAWLHPPFQLGGWLPSRAAAELCLTRPWLHPPSISVSSCLQLCLGRRSELDSPSAIQDKQGDFGAHTLLCPSLGKMSIQLKLRSCCKAPCVLELRAGSAFPCLFGLLC